jgi:hypothetical protein
MTRMFRPQEYRAVIDAGFSFCDCCGGKFEQVGLIDDFDMPDFSLLSGDGSYPLQSGFSVCYPCAGHAEDGPCQPDREVAVLPSGENPACEMCAEVVPTGVRVECGEWWVCASCLAPGQAVRANDEKVRTHEQTSKDNSLNSH